MKKRIFNIFFLSVLLLPVIAQAVDPVNFCTDPGFLRILMIVNTLISVIKVLVPLLIIIMGIIDFSKAVFGAAEEEIKKSTSALIQRVIAGIIIFLAPTLVTAAVNIVFDITDVESRFEDCAGNANLETIKKLEQDRKNGTSTTGSSNNVKGGSNSTGKGTSDSEDTNIEKGNGASKVEKGMGINGEAPEIRMEKPNSSQKNWNATTNRFTNAGAHLVGQCTWYAHGRAREIFDYELQQGRITKEEHTTKIDQLQAMRGHAQNWYNQNLNQSNPFPVGTVPKPGALLITSNTENSAGHVAVVEKVSGATLHISEGGTGYGGFRYHEYQQSAAEYENHTTRAFVGYIYLLD